MTEYEIRLVIQIPETESIDEIRTMLSSMPAFHTNSIYIERRSQSLRYGYVGASPFTYTGGSYATPWTDTTTQ